MSVLAVAAHAPTPTGATTGEQVQEWWAHFDAVVRPLAAKFCTVVAIDANARVGSVVSPAVGSYCPSEEDMSGTMLREFAERASLAAPSTFPNLAADLPPET
eukprot:2823795-Alexandrium_andersonii.AAC.1